MLVVFALTITSSKMKIEKVEVMSLEAITDSLSLGHGLQWLIQLDVVVKKWFVGHDHLLGMLRSLAAARISRCPASQ